MAKTKTTEEQFGNLLVNSASLNQLCSASKSVYIAKELKTSLGVPDYVLLTEEDYHLLKSFTERYSDARLSGKYAAVVYYVAKQRHVDVEELAILLSKKRSEVIKTLSDLEKWGIVEIDKNEVRVNSTFDIPKLNSVAIELKLSSWQKALWQAVRNGSQFASSYVVMPSEKLDLLSSKAELFEVNNVNTAVFDIDEMTLTHVREDKNPHELINSRYSLESLDCLMQNLSSFQHVAF